MTTLYAPTYAPMWDTSNASYNYSTGIVDPIKYVINYINKYDRSLIDTTTTSNAGWRNYSSTSSVGDTTGTSTLHNYVYAAKEYANDTSNLYRRSRDIYKPTSITNDDGFRFVLDYDLDAEKFHITGSPVVTPPSERLRAIMRQRQSPALIGRATWRPEISRNPAQNEVRARETLRRVIGESKFRQFLAKGFITIVGKSGLVYQVFPGMRHTIVWRDGKPWRDVCVVLSGSYPPTDHIIMRYLMILNDEQSFWRKANIGKNVYGHAAPGPTVVPDMSRPLTEIFAEFKQGRVLTKLSAVEAA